METIPTQPGMGRSLIDHDPHNRLFPMRALLPDKPRRTKTWSRGKVYNQGSTSSCVGQTFKGILNTRPNSSLTSWYSRSKLDALEIYLGAQDNDEWPGAEPDYEGTSARGACRYLSAKGLITQYRWCFGLDDVLDTLSWHGPVALGVWWHDLMFEPDAQGFIAPVGRKVGGHEVELHGIDVKGGYVVGSNSWGPDWGLKGRFRMTFNSLHTLLADQGDAVTCI